MQGVRHHLIDIRDPWEEYAAGDFHDEARAAVADVLSRGRVPVVAGGVGFYLRWLVHGKPQTSRGSADDTRSRAEALVAQALADTVAAAAPRSLTEAEQWQAVCDLIAALGDPERAKMWVAASQPARPPDSCCLPAPRADGCDGWQHLTSPTSATAPGCPPSSLSRFAHPKSVVDLLCWRRRPSSAAPATDALQRLPARWPHPPPPCFPALRAVRCALQGGRRAQQLVPGHPHSRDPSVQRWQAPGAAGH